MASPAVVVTAGPRLSLSEAMHVCRQILAGAIGCTTNDVRLSAEITDLDHRGVRQHAEVAGALVSDIPLGHGYCATEAAVEIGQSSVRLLSRHYLLPAAAEVEARWADGRGGVVMRPVPDLSLVECAAASYLPHYEDVPDDLKRHDLSGRSWPALFSRLFYSGLPSGTTWIPREGVDADKARRAILGLAGSWLPKHEHKEAGCALLMREWFVRVEVPGEEPYGDPAEASS